MIICQTAVCRAYDAMKPNGQRVRVSCRLRRGWHVFLQSPGRWTKVLSSRQICPDGRVPVNGRELSCHDKIVQMAMQKP